MNVGCLRRSAIQRTVLRADASPRGSAGLWSLPVSACGLLFTLGIAALPGRAADTAEPPTIVVARIDGQPIYRATYNDVLRRAGHDAATTLQEQQQIAARVIEELINEQLIARLLTENGIEVTLAEVDAVVAGLRSQLATRQQTLEEFLQASGRDEDMLRKQMATELGLNKLLVPKMTPDKLQACYEQRQQEFDGTRLRVSHVVLRPDSAAGDTAETSLLERAQEIRRDIVEARLSFTEAVRLHSAGQSRLRDGDLGFIPRHGLLNEAFAREAFQLQKGEVSEAFLTPFGVHLVTVTDVDPGRGTFASARSEVQKQLASEMLREMLDDRRESADIVYSAGIPHFADAIGAASGPQRAVVVEPAGGGNKGE